MGTAILTFLLSAKRIAAPFCTVFVGYFEYHVAPVQITNPLFCSTVYYTVNRWVGGVKTADEYPRQVKSSVLVYFIVGFICAAKCVSGTANTLANTLLGNLHKA